MDHNNLLEIHNLTIQFRTAMGYRKVVDNLSYTLKRGETLGIVGESGSGKTVSSLAVMGLLPHTALISGDIQLFPKGATRPVSHPELGRQVAMIFQEPMTSLNPVKKCGQQVCEMLLQHESISFREAKKRSLEMFREVMLPRPEKIFNSYPHEISGGQKQRVMIAMALICHPDLLIADEPTTALDVTVQKTILNLLTSLQKKYHIGIIFISHDLGVVAQIADRLAVMYQGKIVEQGELNQILHHPTQPYTQGLLACRPPLDSRPYRLPTVKDFLDENPIERKDSVLYDYSSTDTPLMRVRDLSVVYTLKKNLLGKPIHQLHAVDHVNFDIFKGETLGLVGESGCGKTTLGRTLLRLIEEQNGAIEFAGIRLNQLSAAQMRRIRPRIQIIFQDPYSSLNPRICIGDAIREPLRIHNSMNKDEQFSKVLDLMENVGLQREWYGRYPHQLSGGQRQRVCIARALILQPELVVCDESVSALDVSVQAQVLNLLNDLKEKFGLTYLFISHDLSVVRYFSNRILVMEKGRIIESGISDEIVDHPQQEYTAKLMDAIPRI